MKLYIEFATEADQIGLIAVEDLLRQMLEYLGPAGPSIIKDGGPEVASLSGPILHVLTIDPITNEAVTAQLLRKPKP